ncbi:putative serine/threonine-protein kinase STE20-like [Ipomoea triloba]|uniref:putative serine/threonine-protein kinase STE20-like n=1 Tax=Ipomoea triloba TaxID=35885 RepID=UPI00125D14ED|nr:putative serine/threonine-protein kinase STE20-like [Ipomoea triloba]
MIPSSLFSIAQDAPVFARMHLHKNKDDDELINAAPKIDVSFFPMPNSLLHRPDDDDNDDLPPKQAAVMVVKNTEIHTYLVFDHKPIGSSSGMVVYRAVWQLTTTKLVLNRSVALKVADNPDSIAKLRGEVTRSLGVKGQHRNLLRFKTCFMDEQSGKFCVVMPLTHGSFRTIMTHKNHWFSQGGFPKRHVLVILRSLLRTLTFLHTQHIFHGDISAAHIYLCNSSHPLYYHCSHIALGFAATIYEVAAKWVAAPEIYYANQPYSEKADIWLVGITALELAYGGDLLLKLKNRNALEAMIKEIHDNKKLPTNINIYHQMKKTSIHTILKKEVGEDELMNKLKFYIKKWVPFRSSLPGIAGTFAEIVVQCLDWDPKNRPTAHMLLYHPCFNGWPYASESDVYNFVMSNKPITNNKT